MQFSLILFIFFIYATSGEQSLRFILELCRHGARSPILPNNISNWTSYGDLTPTGIRQHYLLGSQLRERYSDFLPKTYKNSEIYVRSTLTNRTIMSAYAQLLGLFPLGSGPDVDADFPKEFFFPPYFDSNISISQLGISALPENYQPIPVHTINKNEEYLLSSYKSYVCPYSSALMNRQLQSDIMGEFNQSMKNVINELIEKKLLNSGANIFDANALYDSLITMIYENRPIPIANNSQLFQDLRFISEFITSYVKFGSRDQQKYHTINLLNNIMNLFDNTLSDKNEMKMVLYSSHDTTMTSILSIMNITNWECLLNKYRSKNVTYNENQCLVPQFASNILFEVWNDVTSNETTIKMLYNFEIQKICNDKESCSLQEFKQFVKNISDNITFNDYLEFCYQESLNDKIDKDKNMIELTLFWCLTISFTCLFISLSVNFWKYKKELKMTYSINSTS